ncbi:hypothetical protein MMC07_006246 [Pseudocyphellaria aurata]|nr:hypothetical protein [Pseudocyphellaria aurata]
MAMFSLQRATWSLQISKTSRTFAVSFTTALPRKHRPKHCAPDSPSVSSTPFRSSLYENSSRRPSKHSQARSVFTSSKVYQEQRAQGAAASEAGSSKPSPQAQEVQDLTEGFLDQPVLLDEGARQVDWTRSFHGLSSEAFSPEAKEILLAPVINDDVEIKPDGILYLPEIKYRRILNKAFGPGAWGLAPRGETIVTPTAVTREYALVALGRLVSVSRGEQNYYGPENIPTAAEGCKSNALVRCCKDLGVASELWDPRYLRKFVKEFAKETFVEHQVTKKRKKIWLRKDDFVKYPFKEIKY